MDHYKPRFQAAGLTLALGAVGAGCYVGLSFASSKTEESQRAAEIIDRERAWEKARDQYFEKIVQLRCPEYHKLRMDQFELWDAWSVCLGKLPAGQRAKLSEGLGELKAGIFNWTIEEE